jgi:hypothetical protein
MPSRNGLIALTLKAAFLAAWVAGLAILTKSEGNAWIFPFAGAVVGTTASVVLTSYVRRGDRRLRVVRGQVEACLRSGAAGVIGVPRRWRPGLVTPSTGRLDFQPRMGTRRDEYAEPLTFTVNTVGRERDIPLSQALLRMGPTWRIVELATTEGPVELAGPAVHLRKAVSVLRAPVT